MLPKNEVHQETHTDGKPELNPFPTLPEIGQEASPPPPDPEPEPEDLQQGVDAARLAGATSPRAEAVAKVWSEHGDKGGAHTSLDEVSVATLCLGAAAKLPPSLVCVVFVWLLLVCSTRPRVCVCVFTHYSRKGTRAFFIYGAP